MKTAARKVCHSAKGMKIRVLRIGNDRNCVYQIKRKIQSLICARFPVHFTSLSIIAFGYRWGSKTFIYGVWCCYIPDWKHPFLWIHGDGKFLPVPHHYRFRKILQQTVHFSTLSTLLSARYRTAHKYEFLWRKTHTFQHNSKNHKRHIHNSGRSHVIQFRLPHFASSPKKSLAIHFIDNATDHGKKDEQNEMKTTRFAIRNPLLHGKSSRAELFIVNPSPPYLLDMCGRKNMFPFSVLQ